MFHGTKGFFIRAIWSEPNPAFPRAKAFSDFIAMLTRIVFLSLAIGLIANVEDKPTGMKAVAMASAALFLFVLIFVQYIFMLNVIQEYLSAVFLPKNASTDRRTAKFVVELFTFFFALAIGYSIFLTLVDWEVVRRVIL